MTWDRLLTIITGNVPARVHQPTVANVRLSVIAAFATNARYAKLQRIFYRRLRSNLRSVFRGVVSEQRFAVPARVSAS